MYIFQCRNWPEIASGGCKSLLQHIICNHRMPDWHKQSQVKNWHPNSQSYVEFHKVSIYPYVKNCYKVKENNSFQTIWAYSNYFFNIIVTFIHCLISRYFRKKGGGTIPPTIDEFFLHIPDRLRNSRRYSMPTFSRDIVTINIPSGSSHKRINADRQIDTHSSSLQACRGKCKSLLSVAQAQYF